jgi:riboflavin biosynthesis pyrimidine reductase
MLEGGGHVNGSVLNARLVDELSILVVPIADGVVASPTSFEISSELPKKPAAPLRLVDVQKLKNGIVWLKYQARNG